MHIKKLVPPWTQKLSNYMPDWFKCLFGNCKLACTNLCMEDDIHSIKSLKLRLHLKVCQSCWRYYHQMRIVSNKVQDHLDRDEPSLEKTKKPGLSIDELIERNSRS